MESVELDRQYSLLLSDFRAWEERLASLGAGASLLQRAFAPDPVTRAIEQREEVLGPDRVRSVVVEMLSRYLVLTAVNPRFFSFVAANHGFRALYNSGIEDKALTQWAMFKSQNGLFDDSRPKPEDLERKIQECFETYPALRALAPLAQ